MLVKLYLYFKNLWEYYFHETPGEYSSSEDLTHIYEPPSPVYDYQPSAPPLTDHDIYQPSAPPLTDIEGYSYDYNSYY